MLNSIQQFCEKGIKNLEKVMVEYSSDMTKIAEMVYGVTDSVIDLGLSIISEELEMYDDYLRKCAERKKNWDIIRRDQTSILTSLGTVVYHKTYFKNKTTGERCYLLDQVMGIEKHTRMTEDAEAKILEEAVESSYRKGGENASLSEEFVSKQTVKNKVHELRFPELPAALEKKTVPYLYIDADEDHVSLQYLEQKGDIGKRRRINTIMPKIVYVYEGITHKNGRNELINAVYIGGVYEGEAGNQELWNKVWTYIDGNYETEEIKRIYINGDGAGWIKAGEKMLHKGKFVLDKFHMHKYIIGATSHLEGSTEDARNEIYRAIHRRKKWMVEDVFERILNVTEKETKRRTVEAARTYILENWTGIMEQVRNKDNSLECSAEGHVSHIYSDRMSSRPLGWSRTGADKMAQLRVYYYNRRNMLELVRYQKQELPMAAGAEKLRQSAAYIMEQEHSRERELGSLANMKTYSIPYTQIKKIANIKNRIWGL